MPFWKKVHFSAFSIFLFFLFLEVAARLIVPERDTGIYREHEKMISVIGCEALNETMEFDPDLFWRLKKNLRDFHVAGYSWDAISWNFTVNTHNGLRSTPVSSEKNGFRILALGDSCTFGVGVNDMQTWPVLLENLLGRSGIDVDVINAGVPGYSVFQGMRFLEKREGELKPDLVVMTFGFNDLDSWGSLSDRQIAREMALRSWEKPLMHSRFYYGLKKWFSTSKFIGISKLKKGSDSAGRRPGPNLRPRLSPEEFHETLKQVKRFCDNRDIKLILMIWPLKTQVELMRREPIAYQAIIDKLCREEGIACVNLIEIFIQKRASLFIDNVHANIEGHHAVAEALYSFLKRMLNERRMEP